MSEGRCFCSLAARALRRHADIVKRACAKDRSVVAGHSEADVASGRHRDCLRSQRRPTRAIERIVSRKRASAADNFDPARSVHAGHVLIVAAAASS